jgi:uncharacterized protein YjbI with pentapeptide repeats
MTDQPDSSSERATPALSPLARLWDHAKRNPLIASLVFVAPLVAAGVKFGKDAIDLLQKIDPPFSVTETTKGLAADAIESRIEAIQRLGAAKGLSQEEIRTLTLALESMVNRRAPVWPTSAGASKPSSDIRLAMMALGNLIATGHRAGAPTTPPTFTGINLEGIDATDANWRGFRFQNVNLSAATLLRADLTGSLFQDVKLARVQATEATLIGSTIESSCIEEAVFLRANLSKLNAVRSDFNAADLRNAILTGSVFQDTRLHQVDFSDADLSNADFALATEVSHWQLKRAKPGQKPIIPPQAGWRKSNITPCR